MQRRYCPSEARWSSLIVCSLQLACPRCFDGRHILPLGKHTERPFIQANSAIWLAQLFIPVSSCRFAAQAEEKRPSCDLWRATVPERTPALLGEERELLRIYCRCVGVMPLWMALLDHHLPRSATSPQEYPSVLRVSLIYEQLRIRLVFHRRIAVFRQGLSSESLGMGRGCVCS